MKFIEATDPAFLAAFGVGAFRGAVTGLSNADYHANKLYWSSTDLKYMYSNSPAHFKALYFGEKREPKKQTEAMTLGSLVHCLLLTPNELHNDFFYMPDINLRTNDGKAQRDDLLIKNPGKSPYSTELMAQAIDMRDAAMANTEIQKRLQPGVCEAAYFWTCPYSGLNFKAKLDQSCREWFCELKTTSDASPDNFSKHADYMDYDLSLYHYREGLRLIKDISVPAYFIVIEQEWPHVTVAYPVGDLYFETGHAKWLSAVDKLSEGIKKGFWPGYFPVDTDVPELQPPMWAINKTMPTESVMTEDDIF